MATRAMCVEAATAARRARAATMNTRQNRPSAESPVFIGLSGRSMIFAERAKTRTQDPRTRDEARSNSRICQEVLGV